MLDGSKWERNPDNEPPAGLECIATECPKQNFS